MALRLPVEAALTQNRRIKESRLITHHTHGSPRSLITHHLHGSHPRLLRYPNPPAHYPRTPALLSHAGRTAFDAQVSWMPVTGGGLEGDTVVAIACGAAHTLALTSEGQVSKCV